MKKRVSLIIFVIFITVLFSGCWDYREIDKLSIVTGVAIDRTENGKYRMTFEIVDTQEGGIEKQIKSKLIESEGASLFEAIRNSLRISSPRLYFGHMNIVVISEQIAREGVIDIVDVLSRDAEPRLNVDLMVSKEKTANEILSSQSTTEAIRAFEIEQMLDASEADLSKSPRTRVYQFINDLPCEGIAPVLPALKVVQSGGKKTFALSGAAVFKGDKMIGYLDDEESMFYCFISDKVRRDLIVITDSPETGGTNITLEIYDSETTVKPVYSDGKVSMDIKIKVRAALSEDEGNSKSESNIEVLKIQKATEEYLKSKVALTAQIVQKKYSLDIFGFGKKIHSEMPQLWKEIQCDWIPIYREMDVNVSASVEIRNRGLLRHPIKVGGD
jgi:spore germination protein KC